MGKPSIIQNKYAFEITRIIKNLFAKEQELIPSGSCRGNFCYKPMTDRGRVSENPEICSET